MINFSFIIPHKNTPDLLWKALRSIPRRNDVEIIVVDDNSDPSIVDFNHFPGQGEDNVTVLLTKEGRGAGYARNIGLQKATGKWVTFCDADDFYNPCLASVLEEFKNSSADIVLWMFNCIDIDTGAPGHRGEINNEALLNAIKNGNFEDVLLLSAPVKGLYSRQFINDNHIYFNESYWGNDVVFSTKVAVAAKNVAHTTEKVYCITQHASFGLVSTSSLESFVVRFHQNAESTRIARRKFKHNLNLHKWFFSTWFTIYKSNKIQGLRLLPTAIIADKWHFVKESIKCYISKVSITISSSKNIVTNREILN